MTTISQGQPEYAVHIYDGEEKIGATSPTGDQSAAKNRLSNLRAVYKNSRLMLRLPGFDWAEASESELDNLASVTAAYALLDIFQRGLPRLTWVLSDYEPNKVSGQAQTREAVEEYARLLGVEVAEGDRSTVASGDYLGAKVRVSYFSPKPTSLNPKPEQTAAVSL